MSEILTTYFGISEYSFYICTCLHEQQPVLSSAFFKTKHTQAEFLSVRPLPSHINQVLKPHSDKSIFMFQLHQVIPRVSFVSLAENGHCSPALQVCMKLLRTTNYLVFCTQVGFCWDCKLSRVYILHFRYGGGEKLTRLSNKTTIMNTYSSNSPTSFIQEPNSGRDDRTPTQLYRGIGARERERVLS